MEMFTIFPVDWNWNVRRVFLKYEGTDRMRLSILVWPADLIPGPRDEPAEFGDIHLMRNAFENTKKTFHVKCFIISILTRSKFAPSQIHLLSYKK